MNIMKDLKNLGRLLSKVEQRAVIGSYKTEESCHALYGSCAFWGMTVDGKWCCTNACTGKTHC